MTDQLRSELLFKLRLDVAFDRGQRIGKGPLGVRGIYPVNGGDFEGPRLKGRVLPDGADWITWRNDGAMVIDVRTSLETDDGALIALTYTGLVHPRTDAARASIAKGDLAGSDDIYISTTKRFETADERYDWLNRVIAVGKGLGPGEGPGYRVFAIL